MLVDNVALGVLVKYIVCKLLGITDRTRNGGGCGSVLGTNDTCALNVYTLFGDISLLIKSGLFT